MLLPRMRRHAPLPQRRRAVSSTARAGRAICSTARAGHAVCSTARAGHAACSTARAGRTRVRAGCAAVGALLELLLRVLKLAVGAGGGVVLAARAATAREQQQRHERRGEQGCGEQLLRLERRQARSEGGKGGAEVQVKGGGVARPSIEGDEQG
eukprot:3947993-Prymnesium_polylepis.1